ncbi:MAG: acyltransferase family protein [Prevotella sp.]|nr:acyltransferase family protein [Prevotella sp.]
MRIGYIDAMRGFTMIFVVYCHVLIFGFGSDALGYNDVISKFRMPLFFFISGWVFYKAGRIWTFAEVKSILWKKFLVQIIPFLVFMLLFLYVFDLLDPSSFGNDKSGYWFTYVLFAFFVLYVISVCLFQHRENGLKGDILVFSFVVLVSLVSFLYAKYYFRYSETLGNAKVVLGLLSFAKWRYFIYFCLGTLVKKYFSRFIALTDNQYAMAIVVSIFVLLTIFPQVYAVNVIEIGAYLIMGIAGILLTMTFFRKKSDWFAQEKFCGRCLQYVGRRTLDIYVLHYFFLPRNIEEIGRTLYVYDNKLMCLGAGLFLSVFVIAFCLLISEIIRLSPFLGHYLFGAKRESL